MYGGHQEEWVYHRAVPFLNTLLALSIRSGDSRWSFGRPTAYALPRNDRFSVRATPTNRQSEFIEILRKKSSLSCRSVRAGNGSKVGIPAFGQNPFEVSYEFDRKLWFDIAKFFWARANTREEKCKIR